MCECHDHAHWRAHAWGHGRSGSCCCCCCCCHGPSHPTESGCCRPSSHHHGDSCGEPASHHHDGGSCHDTDHGPRLRRRFVSREEKIARLEAYLAELQAEAKAVEEKIARLREPCE